MQNQVSEKSGIRKLTLYIFLSFIIIVILFPVLYPRNNLGRSLKTLNIKGKGGVKSLSSVIDSTDKKLIIFYSSSCAVCRKIIGKEAVRDKYILIDINYTHKGAGAGLRLMPGTELKIISVPYAVEVDTSLKIIRELRQDEIE